MLLKANAPLLTNLVSVISVQSVVQFKDGLLQQIPHSVAKQKKAHAPSLTNFVLVISVQAVVHSEEGLHKYKHLKAKT